MPALYVPEVIKPASIVPFEHTRPWARQNTKNRHPYILIGAKFFKKNQHLLPLSEIDAGFKLKPTSFSWRGTRPRTGTFVDKRNRCRFLLKSGTFHITRWWPAKYNREEYSSEYPKWYPVVRSKERGNVGPTGPTSFSILSSSLLLLSFLLYLPYNSFTNTMLHSSFLIDQSGSSL
jgi:hypothetical protein